MARFGLALQPLHSQEWLCYWDTSMRGKRAITVAIYALAPCLMAASLHGQDRLEDRTDTKNESKANSGKAKAGKSGPVGKRVVWNLDGGVFFATDGHLQNGSCFRLSGQMNAPDFFDGLRRVDSEEGSNYLLRDKPVTEYPGEVHLLVHVLDYPCSPDLRETAARPPLTRELMSTLRLNLFWKDGVHLRPVEESRRVGADVRRLGSYATGPAAEELAPRFEWNYAFKVNSEGVPLTHDLVLVIEDPEHKICARVAARM